MKSGRTSLPKSKAHRRFASVIAGVTVLAGVWTSSAFADPAEDAVIKLNELSRQAERLTEDMHSAQLVLDQKLQAQSEAEAAHAADLSALDTTRVQLVSYQGSVDKLAASVYMGGTTDGLNAILTASSPQGLIDKMAVQKVMGTEMAAQMKSFRHLNEEAVRFESASAKSAADAKMVADEAAAVRADLQRKQSQLQVQIVAVKSRYLSLTPNQRAVLAAPAPLPPAFLALPAPVLPAPEAAPSNDIAALAAVPLPGAGSDAGVIAVQAALTRIGSPYSWGAGGPGAFDCSGLVQWAFQQAGVFLPHSSYAQAAGGQPVSMDQMQPGDVITYYSDASHVGMYVGDGMMVHASTFGIPVAVVPVNNAPIFNVRRY